MLPHSLTACGALTSFYNFLAFGGARGDGAIRYWVPILLTLTVWLIAAVLVPLLLRVIPNRLKWLHASREEERKRLERELIQMKDEQICLREKYGHARV